MTRTADARVRLAHIVAAAAVAGLLAAVAIVAPLATPAGAADFYVDTAQEFYDAIEDANAAVEPVNIYITGELDYLGTDLEAYLTADVAVTIYGGSNLIGCTDGMCGTWLTVELAATGSLSLAGFELTGFDRAIEVYDSEVSISDATFVGNGRTSGGSVGPGGGLLVQDWTPPVLPETGDTMFDLTLSNVTFQDNRLEGGDGVALGAGAFIEGDVTMDETRFIDNTVHVAADVTKAQGGGLYIKNSTASISNGTFTGNRVTTDTGNPGFTGAFVIAGGAIYADNVSLTLGTDLPPDDSDLTSNHTDGAGGAIFATGSEFTLEGLELMDNSAGFGGAIYTEGSETHIFDSTLDGNSATMIGGAVTAYDSVFVAEESTFSNNTATGGVGGAVMLDNAYGRIETSVIVGNSAKQGGALYLFGTEYGSQASTYSDNTAEDGAAIFLDDSALYAEHLTIARNTGTGTDVGEYPGQIASVAGSLYDLEFSVIAEPTGVGDNCAFDGSQTIVSNFNAVTDESCGLTGAEDLKDFDLNTQLGLLQFNGGPTWTMMPAQGSMLINAFTGADCLGGADDQRDVERPQGASCDIGAVETFEPIFDTITTPSGDVEIRILNAQAFLSGPDMVDIASLSPAPPAGVVFPYGALSFEIAVWGPGFPADIEIATPGNTNALWKLQGGEWYEYPATREVAESYTMWSFRVIDGGDGDEDGDDNAVIVDPIAPGITAVLAG